jgi:predicted amidohydrolase YtcJ
VTGSIEVGKLADLAVIDRDLLDMPPKGIGDPRVVLTLVEGEPVFADLTAVEGELILRQP